MLHMVFPFLGMFVNRTTGKMRDCSSTQVQRMFPELEEWLRWKDSVDKERDEVLGGVKMQF